MQYTLMSGAGNLFAMIDGFQGALPADPRQLAREVCAPGANGGLEPRPDGLLLVRRPKDGGDCVMELYNADGSRPETCGNGLRCVAKLVHDRGHVASERFVIETDAGPRTAQVFCEAGRGVTRVRIHMGVPKIVARAEPITAGDVRVEATLVDVGNPHCVLFVEDERTAPVTTLGPRLERHARFAHGTNVEFLALRAEGAFLRVWERGVGETQACGSGACAAAVAAVDAGRAAFPLALDLPGGRLVIESDGRDGVMLSGPAEELASGDWPATRAPLELRGGRDEPGRERAAACEGRGVTAESAASSGGHAGAQDLSADAAARVRANRG